MKKILFGSCLFLTLFCLPGFGAHKAKKLQLLIKKLVIVEADAVPSPNKARAACVMVKPDKLFGAAANTASIDTVAKQTIWLQLEKQHLKTRVDVNDLFIVCAYWMPKSTFDKKQAPQYIKNNLQFKLRQSGRYNSVSKAAVELFSSE